MASFPQQFLYIVDTFGSPAELINGARTMANLRTAADPRFSDLNANCGCPALLLDPCRTTFTPPLGVTSLSWAAMDMNIQATPWFVAGVGASSEAYGFYITDWTGLDGAHHSRSVLQQLAGRGSSYYGSMTSTGRTWKLNVQLFGATERGLDYLLHWLENQLLGCCSSDGSGSVWIREFCPTSAGTDPEEGMARADRVALLEGPTWEDAPIADFSCVMRAASFTLGVGDPCLYRPQNATEVNNTAALTSVGLALSTSAGLQGDGPATQSWLSYDEAPCNQFTGTGLDTTYLLPRASYGRMSGVVTITAPGEAVYPNLLNVPALRIIGHADRAGIGSTNPCTNTQKSLMILQGILGGETIQVDLGRRTIRRRGALNGAEWEDGSYLIARTYPLRPWASFDVCDVGAITVEPASLDQFRRTDLVSYFSVNIKAQEHYGCRC